MTLKGFNAFLHFLFSRKPKIMSFNKTINYILNNRCSVSRFGDGEFSYMLGNDMKFEKANIEKANLLISSFKTNNKKVLICITSAFRPLRNNFTKNVNKYYKDYMLANYRSISKFFNYKYNYGDALFTRFYMDYKNKNKIIIKKKISLIKRLWEERNLLIVEGINTKLGVGNKLFDNAKIIRRIICPNNGCMEILNKISKTIQKHYNSNDLVLLSLGAAASYLSVFLSTTKDIQCIDVGHIDIEYIWFLNGLEEKTLIDGKSSAEAKNFNRLAYIYDKEEYDKEIIETLL